MKQYDLFSFGNISLDIIKTPDEESKMVGGAVLHAVWTAHQLGRSVAVLTKISKKDKYCLEEFPKDNVEIYWKPSKVTTSIKNEYTTPTMETRICTNLGQADPYIIKDFPKINARVIQYSGLLTGEINLDIIKFLSKMGPLALDAQGLTRKVFPDGSMDFASWVDMKEALPYVTYFKADAAEAHFLTGINTDDHEGRVQAGKKFVEMGVKEAVISHNKEMIAVSSQQVAFAPFKNRNLKGRTGRGDTSFTTYITERFEKNQADAILYSAALTSLKMEIPGPFKQTRNDVDVFIKQFYS